MIVSNPPWINATSIKQDDFEGGNYDQNESFIRALFKFGEDKLQSRGPEQKDGTLLLVYSDLSATLGLSSKKLIPDLCEQHNLKIKGRKL